MKVDVLTYLALAAVSFVAMVTGGRSSSRRKHKDVFLGENSKFKFGGGRNQITVLLKSSNLLRLLNHRDTHCAPIPVGIDVQVESIDSISEVNMDFTMTLYLRHYWKDERLAFPSGNNQSRTFDSRLVKKIWVPDVFFVHSKRSFIHDTTKENIMLRVYPDGKILYSVRVTVTALCSMDFSSFPLDTQNCSLELESYAYNENDLMLYWKNGNDSLRTDEIVLSQFFIEHFQASSGLAFYSSTGWYNRLFITFILRRHIFFFMLQTYFPTMLMVVLSWVSFWIDRRAVPARVCPPFLFTYYLFIPSTFNASQAMAFDGCFHDNDIELTTFPRLAPTLTSDPLTSPTQSSDMHPTEGTRLRRQRSVRENVDLLVNNSYMIDSYSRLAFPLSYLLFNTIYWSMYS
uniref:GABA(C) receptor n=1 Tax=Neolamprologus brichardi TaxID=32507 RepID=A0A3Q4M8J6_NEOBR